MKDSIIYRLVFTYPYPPDKIALPFVEYKPNTVIFNFEKELSHQEKQKFIGLAHRLDLGKTGSIKLREEVFYLGHWVQKITADTLIKLVKEKYNLDTQCELGCYGDSSKEELSSMNERCPGLGYLFKHGVLEEGTKYLIV
jgi:hypothetical protein